MCLYLNKRKSQKKLVLQKIRRKPQTFNPLKYMQLTKKKFRYIFSVNRTYLELKFYTRFVRKLRKLSKRKKSIAYLYFCCNHAWFKKSKNSRMGKGKGRFVRFVFKTKTLKPLLAINKISKYRLIRFFRYINNLGHFFVAWV